MRPVQEQIVVIVGASSGIGRATAVEFGRHGATVIVAARGEEALAETAEQVRRAGGTASVFVVDVSDYAQLESLAQQVVTQFGRIDTWVNVASVSVYGLIDAMTPEEMTRVIEVNLLGTMYAVRAVLPHMKQQRAGTIINVGSGLGVRAVPLQSAYVAAKHGVKGFTDSLRMELEAEGFHDIHTTLILPSSINTPLFVHARSKTGRKPMPLPPAYKPQLAAESILKAAQVPTRDIYVGGVAWMIALSERLSPALTDRLLMLGGLSVRGQQSNQPDNGIDNLDAPFPGTGSTEGEWVALTKPSLWTRLFELQPNTLLPILGMIAGVVAVRGMRRR